MKYLDPEPCPMGTYNIVDTVLDVEGEPGAGVLHHHHGAGGSVASRLEPLVQPATVYKCLLRLLLAGSGVHFNAES